MRNFVTCNFDNYKLQKHILFKVQYNNSTAPLITPSLPRLWGELVKPAEQFDTAVKKARIKKY